MKEQSRRVSEETVEKFEPESGFKTTFWLHWVTKKYLLEAVYVFLKKKTELGLFLHHECKNEIHFSQSHQAFIPIRFREIWSSDKMYDMFVTLSVHFI